MATIISFGDGTGHRRQCSAKCYDAKGHKCSCLCGGRNHGVGPERAAQNAQHPSDEWVQELQTMIGTTEVVRLNALADQLTLELY